MEKRKGRRGAGREEKEAGGSRGEGGGGEEVAVVCLSVTSKEGTILGSFRCINDQCSSLVQRFINNM